MYHAGIVYASGGKRTPPVISLRSMPAPSEMGPLAVRQALRLKYKVFSFARGSLPEGAGKAVRLWLREFPLKLPSHFLPDFTKKGNRAEKHQNVNVFGRFSKEYNIKYKEKTGKTG